MHNEIYSVDVDRGTSHVLCAHGFWTFQALQLSSFWDSSHRASFSCFRVHTKRKYVLGMKFESAWRHREENFRRQEHTEEDCFVSLPHHCLLGNI